MEKNAVDNKEHRRHALTAVTSRQHERTWSTMCSTVSYFQIWATSPIATGGASDPMLARSGNGFGASNCFSNCVSFINLSSVSCDRK